MSESGGQIGEKLLVLLDTEQKRELTCYVLAREKQNYSSIDNLPSVSSSSSLQSNSTKPLTEIREGNMYFCLEERKVYVSGQEVELTVKEFDALHLLIINRKRVLTFEIIAYQVWGEEYIDITPKVTDWGKFPHISANLFMFLRI